MVFYFKLQSLLLRCSGKSDSVSDSDEDDDDATGKFTRADRLRLLDVLLADNRALAIKLIGTSRESKVGIGPMVI